MLWELRTAEPSHNSVFLAGYFCTLSSNTVRHPNADKVNWLFPVFNQRTENSGGGYFFLYFFFLLSNSVMGIILAS